MSTFTHFNKQGRAHMVDISEKDATERIARARSSVHVTKDIYVRVTEGSIEKGDVLAVAQVAGIMAAKNTSNWIPMCHPLQLKGIDISFDWLVTDHTTELIIEAYVKTTGSTGVEMEELKDAYVTALTFYNMCKAVEKLMLFK